MNYAYTTLAAARAEIKSAATNTTDDAYVLALIYQQSERFYRFVGLDFEPSLETRAYTATSDRVNTVYRLFYLPEPLLAATSVGNDGSTLAQTTGFVAVRNRDTITALQLADRCGSWYPQMYDTFNSVSVTGVWGYHDDYANAWQSVDTITTAGGINTSVTSFTVVDVDGAGLDGLTPRLSAGNLIRVEAEYMRVLATNISTNTVTVRRAVRGTTAASHAQGVAVEVWAVMDDVKRALTRWVALGYTRRASFETATLTDVATVITPGDFPLEVRAVAQR